MAQESREWYQNDTGSDVNTPTNDGPSGQFSGDDLEFESFMFDSGQGVAADLFRSGPLSEASLSPSSATITMQADPLATVPSVPVPESSSMMPQSGPQLGHVQPFMGAETPRSYESRPLSPLQRAMPSQPLTGPQGSAPSTPLSPMEADATGASYFSGSIALPESGPLRHTGPLVDGRTSASGSLSSGQLSSGSLYQSGPLSAGTSSSGSLSSGKLSQTGPLRAGTNTGPLSQGMAERSQSGSLHHNGNGNGNGSGSSIWPGASQTQTRLSGLLSQQQLEHTDHTGGNTGPLGSPNIPSRFMQTGPLTAADAPDAHDVKAFTPLPEQFSHAMPAPTSPSMSMFSQGGWSDSSLAAVEDFSSLLLAMDGARRYMTSGLLSAGMLSDNATAQDLTHGHETSTVYSDAVPTTIHNIGPYPVEVARDQIATSAPEFDDGAYTQDVPHEQPLWSAEPVAETWDVQSVMPAVDAPPLDEMPVFNIASDDSSYAPEWEAHSEHSVVSEPAAPFQLEEGTFAGQNIEFEPFMFNGGHASTPELPGIEEFMPVVTGMESAFSPAPTTQEPQAPYQQSEALTSSNGASPPDSADGDLPFWLRGTEEPSVSDNSPEQEDNAGLPTVSVDLDAQDHMMSQAPAFSAPISTFNDYADLPPIDPFDFTSLGLEVEEEGFGLNTEELSGHGHPHYDLMTATADLQVVASILGTDPDLQTLTSETFYPQIADDNAGSNTGVQATAPMASVTQVTSALEGEQSNELPTSQLDSPPKESDTQPRSWTATVTSNLSLDALNAAQPGTILLNDDTAPSEVEGLGVSPFSYTELDLDEEESPTGMLNVPKFSKTGPLNSIAAADLPYSMPKPQGGGSAKSSANQSHTGSHIWSTSWLGDTSSQALDEKLLAADPTLPFSTASLEQPESKDVSPWQTQSDDAYTSALETLSGEDTQPEYEPVLSYMRDENQRTGSLVFDSADTSESVEEGTPESEIAQYGEPIFTMTEELESNLSQTTGQDEPASIGRAHTGMESSTHTQQTWGAVAEPQYQQPASLETRANAVPSPYSYQPVQEQEQPPAHSESGYAVKKEPSKFPTSILTSGPLPSLDGFEELQEMITRNPDDVGAYMALAAAYSQVGDTDTQLRVFRRVLRKPSISNKILRLISEELSDYESTFDGHPHFHQVRGDLYMKQNRYQEAIAEYNKIV